MLKHVMHLRYSGRRTYQNFSSDDENFVHTCCELERSTRKNFTVIHNNSRTLFKRVAHLRYRARKIYPNSITYNENFVSPCSALERSTRKNITIIHNNLRNLLKCMAHLSFVHACDTLEI